MVVTICQDGCGMMKRHNNTLRSAFNQTLCTGLWPLSENNKNQVAE